ncbi:MAG: hypothetical protein K6A32_07095 [Bacteroidales bacterium]|nr:hypothetical protein [Bacteroidales bacterium]
MKNLLKILAAVLVIALPMVVASCGSDDEEEGPVTYTYNWTLQNTDLGSSATTNEKMAALQAEATINGVLAKAFANNGFTVDADNQKFTIETEDDVDRYDNAVKSAVYAVLAGSDVPAVAEALPSSAKVVVKRGSKTIIENKLR